MRDTELNQMLPGLTAPWEVSAVNITPARADCPLRRRLPSRLPGDRRHRLSVNGPWRLAFRFEQGGPACWQRTCVSLR